MGVLLVVLLVVDSAAGTVGVKVDQRVDWSETVMVTVMGWRLEDKLVNMWEQMMVWQLGCM